MANATQFRDGFYSYSPPWLCTGMAEKYMYTLELMRDLLMEKANAAVLIRFPGLGDASQIPYLAHDRQLVQGPNEGNNAFVGRLQNAFTTWAVAGSAYAVLSQLQAYAQGFQPGIPSTSAVFRIVSNARARDATDSDGINSWYTVLAGDPIGQPATLAQVSPHNFNWDGADDTWRAWLVSYQYAVATGQSGSAAAYTSASGGSFTTPGQNVSGVWVPRVSGTPVNAPFILLSGLSGLTDANVGDVITVGGSAHRDNNGTFQIVSVVTATTCLIVNLSATVPDAGPLTWSIARYGWIPPGVLLSGGTVWGGGEASAPPLDTGSNVRGNWGPTTLPGIGQVPSYSWGLRVSSLEIDTVRGLLKTWKGGNTYYPQIIVCYDGPSGVYNPLSSFPYNPDGHFGSFGVNDNGGNWVPNRKTVSSWDAYCQGTGVANACGVENIT
jgi:hypothetical protein